MTLREQRIAEDGGVSTTVLIDEPSVKVNPNKNLGVWALPLTAETRDKVVQGLLQGVEEGIFTAVVFKDAPSSSKFVENLVLAWEEGYLTRRDLKARLDYFRRIGFDDGWFYSDVGAERHKSARRMLCARDTRSPISEFLHRAGNDKPIIREARLPKS